MIEEFNIPLDEYPRRCINQIEGWEKEREDILKDGKITHEELKRLCQMSGIDFNSPRSNQEERDSALLAITCSGLPIKYKVVESEINK